MSNNKIAIVGGAGFVGSSLRKRLNFSKRSYQVYDINHSKDIVDIDIEIPESLKQLKGVDCIINLAAVHRDDIKPITRYDDVNVQGSINICNAARDFGINKIIFTSSVAIYGFAPPNTDESGEPNYFNDYGRTKYLAEQEYKKWQKEDPNKRTLIIVRPTVIFGEGNRGNVYNLLKQIASRKFVMIGNGSNKKSMAYVENVSAFIDYSLDFKNGIHIYNYIDKPDYDMNTLISLVRKMLFNKNNVGIRLPRYIGIFIGKIADVVANILNKNLPVSTIRVEKFMGTTQFSSSLTDTEFVAPCSLEEGLLKTIRYEFLEDNSDKKTFETE